MLKGDIPFGIPYWSTNEPPYLYLSTQQIDDIRQAKAHIFTNVAILFDDNFGSHVQEGCWWIQAPADPQSPWHECSVHHTQVDNQDEFLKQQ